MKFHNPIVLAVLAASAAFAASPAAAAITVLGNTLAARCYQIAEFNGDAQDGVKTCDDALSESALAITDRAATYINRGILKARLGNSRSALDDYNTGLSIRPSLAEGYVDRGATLIAMRRYDEALVDLDKGIAMGSKNLHIAYYDRAIARERLGNVRGAYEDYKQALALEPGFALAAQQLQRFRVIRKSADPI